MVLLAVIASLLRAISNGGHLLDEWIFKDLVRRAKEGNQERTATMQATLYAVTIAAGFVAFAVYRKHKMPTTIQPRTKEEIKGVINFTPVGEEKISKQAEMLASRARPNKRLEIVFGICNSFTTKDTGVHKKFLDAAKDKMQKAVNIEKANPGGHDAEWGHLIEIARIAARDILSEPVENLRIVDVARVVTLKVMLRVLFDAPDTIIHSKESTEHLILIGQKINDLWIASKDKTKPLPKWDSEPNRDIHRALRASCATQDPDNVDPLRPEANPMNWLLPAYETMWRVVLACVIELRFRRPEIDILWCNALQDYIDNPTRKQFQGATSKHQVDQFCAKDIVKEALRLYPPTRHVYRRFTEDEEDVKADIESLHHDKDVFGPDPLCFRPERWFEIREKLGVGKESKEKLKANEEQSGFMPFAGICPADKSFTQGFGFKVIALLVGVLCEQLDGIGEWVLEDGGQFRDMEKPLPSERDAFDHLYLVNYA